MADITSSRRAPGRGPAGPGPSTTGSSPSRSSSASGSPRPPPAGHSNNGALPPPAAGEAAVAARPRGRSGPRSLPGRNRPPRSRADPPPGLRAGGSGMSSGPSWSLSGGHTRPDALFAPMRDRPWPRVRWGGGLHEGSPLGGVEAERLEHLRGVLAESGNARPGGGPRCGAEPGRETRLVDPAPVPPVIADHPAELTVDRVVDEPGCELTAVGLGDRLDGHSCSAQLGHPGRGVPGLEGVLEERLLVLPAA